MKIVLTGNPNSGKSTVFNSLTGLHQRTGNFPGVTVERKSGKCRLSNSLWMEVVDLPGTYSLFPVSEDEKVCFSVLANSSDPDYPDLVAVVADASSLKRNLLLCTQIMDLGFPVILCLNMMDIADKNGTFINTDELEKRLKIPVIPMVARKGEGIGKLKEVLKKYAEEKKPGGWKKATGSGALFSLPQYLRQIIPGMQTFYDFRCEYLAYHALIHPIDFMFMAPRALEKIYAFQKEYSLVPAALQGDESLARYVFLDKILDGVVKQVRKETEGISIRVDRILMHGVFGYIFFVVFMLVIFQSVFNWAVYPMEWIEQGFSALSNLLSERIPDGPLNDLLVNGVVAGLSGVLIFLPQIAFLFFFICLMEDSGYMARVIFLMDKIMRRFGMSGKSVVPLAGGMACAVPSIMAARNIENRKDRLITIMVTPLMSCSARLPVYTLLISMFVPEKNYLIFFSLKGVVLTGLYTLGFLAALLSGYVMKKTIRKNGAGFFIYELPTYKLPGLKTVSFQVLGKCKSFVYNAGIIIVSISVVLWFLSSFGPSGEFEKVEKKYSDLRFRSHDEKETELLKSAEKLEVSYAGKIGRFIEPVIRPLGFNWKIGIALITSFAAREIFVGTMATIYSVGKGPDVHTGTLSQRMKNETDPVTGKPVYTAAVAISLILFYAFAMQCMSTLAVTRSETRSWKWPLIMIIYMTGLAYLFSFLVYQILK